MSCYDRVLTTGTVPVICYAEGMTRFLYANGIRIFDYPQFAQTLRDRVRGCAASLATTAGVTIEHISKSYIRKEEVVGRVLERRGDHPGLVHIISAMEACDSYRPWHDKASGKTFVRPDGGTRCGTGCASGHLVDRGERCNSRASAGRHLHPAWLSTRSGDAGDTEVVGIDATDARPSMLAFFAIAQTARAHDDRP